MCNVGYFFVVLVIWFLLNMCWFWVSSGLIVFVGCVLDIVISVMLVGWWLVILVVLVIWVWMELSGVLDVMLGVIGSDVMFWNFIFCCWLMIDEWVGDVLWFVLC